MTPLSARIAAHTVGARNAGSHQSDVVLLAPVCTQEDTVSSVCRIHSGAQAAHSSGQDASKQGARTQVVSLVNPMS